MEKVLLDIIEEIIELLENDNYESYIYDNHKFHIIDKYNNIDFQAKLSNNNFYFKDNISGITFMKTKKYINDTTTLQQMLIIDDTEKNYYSYLEKEGYVSLVRAIRIEGKDSLVCNNLDVLNHTWDEIEEYSKECFENISGLDEIEAVEIAPENDDDISLLSDIEDEHIKKVFNYTGDSENQLDATIDQEDELEQEDNDDLDEEYESDANDELVDDLDLGFAEELSDDEFDYEFNQIAENEKYGLSDIFEKNSIKDYIKYIQRKEECESNGDRYSQAEDHLPMADYTEAIDDYYSKYQLAINNDEINGQAKCRIIADCEAAVDEKYYSTTMFDESVINLKAVIESLHKNRKGEKNNDLEK